MANPQKENGFTPIANEILEALCRVNLSPYESRIVWFLIRKTYGYQKKMDRISLSQFSEFTGIEKPNVRRAIRSLNRKCMVISHQEAPNRVFYGVQKDYDQWKGLSVETVSKKTLSVETTNVVSRDNKGVSVETPTKERKIKERVRDKPSPSKNSDSRVKEFFAYWKEEYQNQFGEPYHFSGGKEGRLVKDYLRQFDLPKLQKLALRFFGSKDSWVQEHGGYTIGVFASQINKIISTAKAKDNRPPRKEMPA